MFYTMVIEQTKAYPKRMEYVPETNSFQETDSYSLFHVRNFHQPYGWIKESGTPPQPHWDVILMSDKDFNLGDEVEVQIIGVFMRNDGDHKYLAVEKTRGIDDIEQLEQSEKEDLTRLYSCRHEGEGWFGKDAAKRTMETCDKAL